MIISDYKLGMILCGCNQYALTGKRVIYLNFNQFKKDLRKDPLEALNTVAHEVCHFKIDNHGNDFKKLLTKAMKPYNEYDYQSAEVLDKVLELTGI